MSHEDDPTQVIPPAPGDDELGGSDNEEIRKAQAAADAGETDLLEEIRELREDAKGEHYLILEIPSYKGKLGARYKVLDSDVTEKIAKRLRKVRTGRNLIGSVDTIITACEQIVVRDPGHPKCLKDDNGDVTEWRPIDPSSPIPVRFDTRLAEILRLPTSEAREIVVGLFPTDMSIIDTNVKVSRWMVDTTREVDDDLLGE